MIRVFNSLIISIRLKFSGRYCHKISMKLLYLTLSSILLFSFGASSFAQSSIKLQVFELPPYMIIRKDGSFGGSVLETALAAFKKAKIPYTLEKIPASRQLARLKKNDEAICSIGWIKNSDREKFAKFSKIISQDPPWVIIANRNIAENQSSSFDDIFNKKKYSILVKQSLFYGDYLEGEMAEMKTGHQTTSGNILQLFKMISAGRANIMFSSKETFQYYIDQGEIVSSDFKVITPRRRLPGFKRYLMCSQMVSDDLIKSFNTVLPSVPIVNPD